MNLITEIQAIEALADMRAHLAEVQMQLAEMEPERAATVTDLHSRLTALIARRSAASAEGLASIDREIDDMVQTLGQVESSGIRARSATARAGSALLAQLQAGLARWRQLMASDSAGPLPVEGEIAQMQAQFVLFARGGHIPPGHHEGTV